jgi:hypothetical protein
VLNNKQRAIELRKSGLSYRAIQKELDVPLGSLSLWLANEKWSQEVSRNLKKESALAGAEHLKKFKKARGFALQFSYARAKEDAEKEYKKLIKNPLFLSGLMLYWIGGNHSSPYYISFRSADPRKVLLFRRFLEESLEVSPAKIRYSLLLSSRQKEDEIKEKWSKEVKIPLQSFTKSTFARKPRNKSPTPYAVCTTTYPSRTLKEKVLVWLRLVSESF